MARDIRETPNETPASAPDDDAAPAAPRPRDLRGTLFEHTGQAGLDAPRGVSAEDLPLLELARELAGLTHRGGLLDKTAARIRALPRGPLRRMLAERLADAEAALRKLGEPLALVHPSAGDRPRFNDCAGRFLAELQHEEG